MFSDMLGDSLLYYLNKGVEYLTLRFFCVHTNTCNTMERKVI